MQSSPTKSSSPCDRNNHPLRPAQPPELRRRVHLPRKPRLPELRRRVRHQTKYPQGCFDSAQQSCSSTSIKTSKNCIAILVAKVTKDHTFLLNQTLSPRGRHQTKKTAECFDSAHRSCSSTSIKASKNCIAILVAKVTKGHTFLLNQTLSPVISRSRATKQSICVFLSPQHLLSLS